MTQQRIEKLKLLIQESRLRLLDMYPSFSLLLMYLRYIAVPNMKKMSTDGENIYFNPMYLEKLTPAETDYILCHQIMHIAFGHLSASIVVDEIKDYHFACEVFINNILYQVGFPIFKYTHLGILECIIPWAKTFSIDNKTEMEIYQAMPISLTYFDEKTQNRYLADSHEFWNAKNLADNKEVVIIDFPDITNNLSVELQGISDEKGKEKTNNKTGKSFRNRIFSTLTAIQKAQGKTKNESVLTRTIGTRKKPKMNWKKLLIDFLQEETNDYSFSPPDKRYINSPFFIPDFNEKDFILKEILFMVDTSGSISQEELTAAYTEICGVIEQFNGKIIGKICFFDSEVYPPIDFSSITDITSIAPIGGGGTSFDIIFDFVEQKLSDKKPSCIIIFTDGKATFPAKKATAIPVFWIINNEYITPPWGKLARINIDKK